MISASGEEDFEQRPDSVQSTDLALLAARNEIEDDQGQITEKDTDLNPLEAHEKLTNAKGELDVILDLVKNLESTVYLDFRILSSKPRSANALQDLADESKVKYGRKHDMLIDISARLQKGAIALRAAAANDNLYYNQVARLQRFWKIRLNPMTSEFSDSPFSVDLSLTTVSRTGPIHSNDDNQAGNPSRHAKLILVPLVKDVSGSVKIRNRGASPELSGALGSKSVHQHLISLQQKQLWAIAASDLEHEARKGFSASNFTYSLAEKVLEAVASKTASLHMCSLRPFILEHITVCRLTQGNVLEPSRPYSSTVGCHELLPELAAWISHIFFRDNLYASLDAQVDSRPFVRLRWVPANHPYTSAMNLQLSRHSKILLLIQETSVELEGIPDPSGTTSRWAREGCLTATKHEMGHLVRSIVQQATNKLL
ncbi:hypothetical protein CEUSTIGMA_g13861.t1 [Chlamydomonas eustigma]|uniref:Mediator complex subunit 17 n=1 Tax=Chlamydomonas eustigma TaxID=1157962 RepID=A0A250XTP6_9CHLO|nr:hypothetical protein CEUSTIGMA_g13861.t1 [Chlamydomonas eustigma]|eukprot:GAX86451.1 hypothetical protein CEUSTIGMA_g13861.t1 [Chlamydomonas eustigma]